MKYRYGWVVPFIVAGVLQQGARGAVTQVEHAIIQYVISPQPPAGAGQAALTTVVVDVENARPGEVIQFQMPVWSPGDYRITNQARFVQAAAATDAQGKPLKLSHPDANTWSLTATGQRSAFSYSLPNEPAGLFSRDVQVTDEYAFYNGPSAFMYVVGRKADPVSLHVRTPMGWSAPLSALDPLGSDGTDFSAPDYDTLADAPLLIGKRTVRQFDAVGRTHTLAFFGSDTQLDYDSYVPVIKRLVTEENRTMGVTPYKRYIFFFEVDGPGGGLEHLAGTRIGLPARARPEQMAGEIAHEFFHLWNVKRLRPYVLGPFDYTHPPHTSNLWFSEGITSYYGDLTLCRSGLITAQQYEADLAGLIGFYNRVAARNSVTADKSSYNVWDASNSSGFGGLSYYLKGEVIGLCLDLKLRDITHNMASLDAVMRAMYKQYGLPKPGFPEDGIRDAVVAAGGAEMGPYYDLLARSTGAMPFELCLSYAGLKLTARPGSRPTVEDDPGASAQALEIRKDWLSPVGSAAATAQ